MDAVRKKPAILGTDKINDGIYLTFNDFLDNKPADIQFEYVVSKKRDSISLSEMRADDSVFTKKCWGFCKKGIPYMRINNDFSLLSKIQNTFELNSQQTIRLKYKKASSVFWTAFNIAHDLAGPFPEFVVFDIPLSKPTDTIRGIGFYKLDMETGEIY